MWWPAIGALAVGIIGFLEPRTLRVGHANIEGLLSGTIVGRAALMLVVLKFISWAIDLGSGTPGGTLAPLFAIGGGLGALLGQALATLIPQAGVDARVGALVGMAAIFAGASHALLASIVFAFETTRRPLGLLSLLVGGTAAYLLAHLRMRHSIRTEKLARRGVKVGTEYAVDPLVRTPVGSIGVRPVITLLDDQMLGSVRSWLRRGGAAASHQGFPVVDWDGSLRSVVTRRDLFESTAHDTSLVRDVVKRPVVVIYDDSTMREAADQMVRAHVGRLPVVARDNPRRLLGIITRSDLLAVHRPRLDAEHRIDERVVTGFVRRTMRVAARAPGDA